MSQSQKHIILIPSRVNSKLNSRKNIESLSKKSFQQFSKYEDKVPMKKFKQIKDFSSLQVQQNSHINELDTKYKVYKYGSPNFYSSSIQMHKANSLKNEIKSLDFPFIDGVIKQIRNIDTKQNFLNFRDCQLYPNSMKNHVSHKFKDLLSDKQELKDFVMWFNECCSKIQQKDVAQVKKFQQKQIMIASGFSQIIQQRSKLSKTRSQIIKLLWNKQAQQMEQIVNHFTSKIFDLQKSHLIESSKTHEMYQKQIDRLKSQNQQLSQKLRKQAFLNSGYVNTFRMNRKLIKKQQFALKKLLNINQNIVKENLNLMEINTELVLSSFVKQSPPQHTIYETIKTLTILQKELQKQPKKEKQEMKNLQAKVIAYRKLQIATKKSCLQKNFKSIKNNLRHDIKQNSLKEVQNNQLSEFQLEYKKLSLYNYLMERFQQNPYEKISIENDFLHQDDYQIKTDEIQNAIQQILDIKNIEQYLENQQSYKQLANGFENI